MATSWKSQQSNGEYALQFETDSKEKYRLVEKAAMMAVSGKTAADYAPVVRCKDCQNCEVIYPVKIIGQEPEEVYYCKAHNGSRNPKDFCSDGRRKNEISKATDS